MTISKSYQPADIETKWYDKWMEKGFFRSTPDERESFTIVIPPPNVTGELHMGHVLNNTIQDIFIRRARMQGKNACWVPGTDHASIATEAKVVKLLADRGIDKRELTREKFLEYAWEWKDKYGGIILQQLRRMGASCDWDRTAFTMDPAYYRAVIKVFVDLYNKGYIYRGTQMINWDPKAQTALSDEEVYFKEVNSRLYHVRYKIEGSDESITVATTRPETILGDTAICVHPEDERYKHLVGKRAFVPMVERPIPIIADPYVEMEFGTGALKVTPAHDKNDYNLGITHQLETIDIFTPEGKLNENALLFVGKDRFEGRKLVAAELENLGQLVKIEEIKSNVSYSERTDAVVEPRISQQWFCRMKEMAAPALEAVESDKIQLHPAKFKNLYRHWMENIRDWCISRQLWWGQRIPAWYLQSGSVIVAETEQEALAEARRITGNPELGLTALRQEEDVLDTWFSSWLWPEEVFKGITQPGNDEIKYYYPTQLLVTGPDIIFFWVARMIMAGYEYEKERPFDHVYFTGIVRDEFGRKYSKSLGNSPDILKLMDQYGADSLRFAVLVAAPAGNDTLFKESLCEQGRNFGNKIWNALRLVRGWEEGDRIRPDAPGEDEAVRWFGNRFQQRLQEIERLYGEFNVTEVLTTVYSLIWDDFCSWYLEMVKPQREGFISQSTYNATITYFEYLMQLLHPFMPHLTEEIWHNLKERGENDYCVNSKYPVVCSPDLAYLRDAERTIEAIVKVRAFRNEVGISPKEELDLFVKSADNAIYRQWEGLIHKLANIQGLHLGGKAPENSKQLVVKGDELYIPYAVEVDAAVERERLQKELDYTRGFLDSVQKKLANERFVQNAKPEILDKERVKQQDAEAKIRALEESLSRLS